MVRDFCERPTLDLVETGSRWALSVHARIYAGPVIERDLDVFGRTVNLASHRPRGEAGEVLVSGSVAQAARDAALAFEPLHEVALRGCWSRCPCTE